MISRTFDMRQISRDEFFRALHEGDQVAQDEYGHFRREVVQSGPTTTTVNWVEAEQQPSPQAMVNFGADIVQAATEINKEQRRMSNITGASFLGEQFRSHLADVKKQLSAAGDDMQKAMGDLNDTAAQAQECVKQVKAETADLKSALAQFTNGPPPGTPAS